MHHTQLKSFLDATTPALAKSPGALIFAEDEVELVSTIEHALQLGFGTVALFCAPDYDLPTEIAHRIHRIDLDIHRDRAVPETVNRVIAANPGAWLHYCYNAEYLYFPFCESRSIGDLLAFQAEERRASVLTYVIDLYAGDLKAHPNAVDLAEPMLDQSGYYALARTEPTNGAIAKPRQLDFYGGLRWRFEEHVPWTRRRIDRVGLFRATPGLELREDHTFNIEEYNTYSCEWHHNVTAAICSFRTAKALRTNPGSRQVIQTFRWSRSTPFKGQSQQLMDLGLIEPGQWF